jgi:uncharacterized protein DUF3592
MNLALVAPLVVMAIGVNLTFGFARDIYFGLVSRRWPRTHGHIRDLDAYTPARRLGSVAGVEYDYQVAGVEYQSNRYDYTGRDSFAKDIFETFSVGDQVAVWYDPGRPQRAVLVTGVRAGNFGRLLFGACWLYGGWFWLMQVR